MAGALVLLAAAADDLEAAEAHPPVIKTPSSMATASIGAHHILCMKEIPFALLGAESAATVNFVLMAA